MTKELAIMVLMASASFGPCVVIGWIASTALNAIGRNPESAPKIMLNMILGLAFAEAIAIYTLVVVFAKL